MKRKPSSKFFSNLEKAQLEQKLKRQKTDDSQEQLQQKSKAQTSQHKYDSIEEEKEVGRLSTQVGSATTNDMYRSSSDAPDNAFSPNSIGHADRQHRDAFGLNSNESYSPVNLDGSSKLMFGLQSN